jgi:VWFA-related protein
MRSIVAFIFVAAIVPSLARQEIPRFKSGVDVVQVTVTVLDKERHPVTGLTAADFEVLVDGRPRPLAAFAAVTLPDDPSVRVASIPTVAPDVQTNRLPVEGRLVIIVMDRSIPDGQPMQAAHAIANAAIDRLGPNDLGAVVYTGAVSRKYSQGITADRARLHAAANLTTFGAVQEPPPPPTVAAASASRGAPQPKKPQNRVQLASQERSGECRCGVCVLDKLTALAEALAGATGREKSILFVGSDLAIASTVADATGYCAAYIYPARDRLTRALDAANVTFHVLDPRGLEGLGDTAELDQPASLAEQHANAFRQASLGVLPDYTGGRLVVNTNAPADAIGPIFDESRSYYLLAVPRDPAAAKDDDRHRITITVKGRDAIVRARDTYFAADPKAQARRAPDAVAGALNALLPGGDFSLSMNVVPQYAQDGSPEIRVLLGVDSAVGGQLDVLIRTYDRVFTPVGTALKQRLDVPASAIAGSSAFQWASVLKTAPGDYEVRAAVATADGKSSANVIGYVDVPDVEKQGVALSGIVVKTLLPAPRSGCRSRSRARRTRRAPQPCATCYATTAARLWRTSKCRTSERWPSLTASTATTSAFGCPPTPAGISPPSKRATAAEPCGVRFCSPSADEALGGIRSGRNPPRPSTPISPSAGSRPTRGPVRRARNSCRCRHGARPQLAAMTGSLHGARYSRITYVCASASPITVSRSTSHLT